MARFFFNNTLRSYDVAVGSLFSDIWVLQYNRDTKDTINELKVPLTWAPKLHWYLRKHDTLPIDYNVATILPRISFSRGAPQYDSKRQMNKYVQIKGEKRYSEEVQNFIQRWAGCAVPYKIPYTFNIWTYNEIEMNQILEQVLSNFNTQSYNLFVNEVPLLDIGRNCKLNIENASQNYQNEYDLKGDRILRYSFNLQLEGNIYPVIKEQSVIKEIYVNFYESEIEQEKLLHTIVIKKEEKLPDLEDDDTYFVTVSGDYITNTDGQYLVKTQDGEYTFVS